MLWPPVRFQFFGAFMKFISVLLEESRLFWKFLSTLSMLQQRAAYCIQKMLLLDLFINFMYYLSLDYQNNYSDILCSYTFHLSFLRINLKDCFFQCCYGYSAYFSLLFADIKFYLMHLYRLLRVSIC